MNLSYRFLAGLLFLTSMFQLLLCLYEAVCHGRKQRRIADGAIFLALLLLTSYVSAVSVSEQYAPLFPPLLLLLLSVLALVRIAAMMRRTYLASRETLSPSSIKQALDNLNSGVLFADETGRAILANYTIAHLADTLTGSYPQTLMELESALTALPAGRGVEKLRETPELYRFPDGRVWRFQTIPLTGGSLIGFTQTTAQDVTELYEASARLERENAALQEAIGKMRRMMDRIADRIREQETLKTRSEEKTQLLTSLQTWQKLRQCQEQAERELVRREEAFREAKLRADEAAVLQDRAARLDAFRSWLVDLRDKAALPATKAIYQAIIDKLDEQ